MELLELFNRDPNSNYKKPIFLSIKNISKTVENGNNTICDINIGEQVIQMLKEFSIDEMKYTRSLSNNNDIKTFITSGTLYVVVNKLKPNKVIGMIDVRSSMMTPNATEISMLWVNPKYRNKHYGRKLIDFAKQIAVYDIKRPTIVARVYKDNPALEFYKKCGFSF